MGRRSKAGRLDVWMNDELAGHWTLSAGGRHEFSYAPAWLASESARPVSLALPLQASPLRGEVVESVFDNLLPDNQEIRRRLMARFGTGSTRAFELLAEVGRDCVGALQFLPPGEAPKDIRKIKGEALSEGQVAEILRAIPSAPLPGQSQGEEFRISLAGAQEKTALLRHQGRWHRPKGATPSTHIFKLPLGKVGALQADLSASVENEWLCSRIAVAAGIPAAACDMATFGDQRVLVVERFDRALSGDKRWWIRLPQEDMCQAMGIRLGLKYESEGAPGAGEILAFLLGSREARADRALFFRSQILFWMLGAVDGHARNFSVFIGRGGEYYLTPLYDILSAFPILGHGKGRLAPEKTRMAMAVRSKGKHYHWNRITRRHWLEMGKACGLLSETPRILDELVEMAPAVADRVAAGLPKGFPDAVADPILEGFAASAKRL